MDNSLCRDLGVKSKLPGKSHLPSEQELKSYLHEVENLEHTLVRNFPWTQDIQISGHNIKAVARGVLWVLKNPPPPPPPRKRKVH